MSTCCSLWALVAVASGGGGGDGGALIHNPILLRVAAPAPLPSRSRSIRTFLSATTPPVDLSFARYTTPYVPSPMRPVAVSRRASRQRADRIQRELHRQRSSRWELVEWVVWVRRVHTGRVAHSDGQVWRRQRVWLLVHAARGVGTYEDAWTVTSVLWADWNWKGKRGLDYGCAHRASRRRRRSLRPPLRPEAQPRSRWVPPPTALAHLAPPLVPHCTLTLVP